MNKYEERQADRKARFAEKAEKLREESQQLYDQDSKWLDMIPVGQPILVGHHSERRHRNDLNRHHNRMNKVIDLDKKADHYERISKLQNHSISADDEDAISKLTEKLDKLEKLQERMKQINKLYIKLGSEGLKDLSDIELKAVEGNLKFSYDRKPFPSYALTNNNATIRVTRLRIEELQKVKQTDSQDDIIGDGFKIVEDKEQNRILFLFDNKPDENIRVILKSYGFKWSPTRSAWVRMINANGRAAVDFILKKLNQIGDRNE